MTTEQTAGETAAVTWESLTPDEQEALRYLRGICELDESIDSAVLDSLVSKGLADVTNDDEWYGRDYMITIAGSIVLSQESAPGNERPSTVSAEKPRHEWQDLAPTGKAWVAEIQTDRLQQVMLFESRWDAQEFLDTQLKDTHPEHMDDAWFESETGSTLGWNGTNDFYLTLEDIFKATKLPATERPATITAAEWIRVAEYVQEGMCEVREIGYEEDDREFYGDPVISITVGDDGKYSAVCRGYVSIKLEPERKFKVIWLNPQPTASVSERPSPAVATAGDDASDELINKILTLLGVTPGDWSSGLSGIYSAIRCNLEIGEPQMSKIEHWTDSELNQDSITAAMFKLLGRAQKAEATLAAKDNEIGWLREALEFYAEPNNWILQHNSGFHYDVIALDEDRGRQAAKALASTATPPTEADDAVASADKEAHDG